LRAVLLLSVFYILKPTTSVAASMTEKVGTMGELFLLLLLLPSAQALLQKFKDD
jgi:hypothetical protein